MPTAGTVNTTLVKIKTGATVVTCLTDASINFTQDTRDTTCKDSNSWSNALPGKRSWEVSGSGLFAYDATNGADTLFTAFKNQTLITVVWGTTVTGDKTYGGTGYLTSLSFSAAGTDENTTFEFTIMGVGEAVSAVNP